MNAIESVLVAGVLATGWFTLFLVNITLMKGLWG